MEMRSIVRVDEVYPAVGREVLIEAQASDRTATQFDEAAMITRSAQMLRTRILYGRLGPKL